MLLTPLGLLHSKGPLFYESDMLHNARITRKELSVPIPQTWLVLLYN